MEGGVSIIAAQKYHKLFSIWPLMNTAALCYQTPLQRDLFCAKYSSSLGIFVKDEFVGINMCVSN